MRFAVILSLIPLLGQIEGENPWRLHLRDGSVVYGYLDEKDWENERLAVLKVQLDEPWRGSPTDRIQRSQLTGRRERERDHERERRYERGWESVGGAIHETEQGPRYVLESEWELAQRAKALVRQATTEEESEDLPANPVAPNVEETAEPGFLRTWGAHVLIGAVAIIALGAITRLCFLS